MFEEIFGGREIKREKLAAYGFKTRGDSRFFDCEIMEGQFALCVKISSKGVDTRLTEKDTGEEYFLYKTAASGSFVGRVRQEIEGVLKDIADNCCEEHSFKSRQAAKILEFARRTYGDSPEFLWEKSPDFAVLRRQDSKKWYALIMRIPKSKLGLDSREIAEVADLRISPEKMADTVDNEYYFPGWHMNKKGWYAVILDNSLPDREILQRIEESYKLAKK